MRFLFLLVLCLFLFPAISIGQIVENTTETNVVKTEYTRLDQITKSFAPLFGNSRGNIEFILVELVNLTTDERILGVEIQVERTDREVLARSMAFSNVGSLWGSSSSVTARNLSKEGYIFLIKEDLDIIINYLNEIVGALGQEQDKFKAYSMTLYDKFELGMLYDDSWSFVIKVDNASYKLDYQNGIEMIKKLSSYRRYIEENS